MRHLDDLDGKLSLKVRVQMNVILYWIWPRNWMKLCPPWNCLTLLNRTVSQQHGQCTSPSLRKKDWRTQHLTMYMQVVVNSRSWTTWGPRDTIIFLYDGSPPHRSLGWAFLFKNSHVGVSDLGWRQCYRSITRQTPQKVSALFIAHTLIISKYHAHTSW